MARVRTSGSLSRAGRPVFGCSEVWLSFHQSSTSTYNETKKESRSTMRHHPLERVWCSIRSGLLFRWPELHITRLRGAFVDILSWLAFAERRWAWRFERICTACYRG